MSTWYQEREGHRHPLPVLTHTTLWRCYNPKGNLRVMTFAAKEECTTFCEKNGEVPVPPLSERIRAFPRPNALRSSSLARKGWLDVATPTSNDWRIVTAEQHRVVLVKGNDLVFFALADADLDNPRPLSEHDKASAHAVALEWARLHTEL